MAWAVGEVLTSANLNTYLAQSSTVWTPTWTNVTVSNGTVVAQYTRIGAALVVSLKLTLGSTSAVSGTVAVAGLPVNPVYPASGKLTMLDNSASTRYLGGVEVAASSGSVSIINSPSGGINTTTPFTWAVNDTFAFEVTYLVG